MSRKKRYPRQRKRIEMVCYLCSVDLPYDKPQITTTCMHTATAFERDKLRDLYVAPRVLSPLVLPPSWCESCDRKRVEAGGFANIPQQEKLEMTVIICANCFQKIESAAEERFVTVELFGKKQVLN